MRMNHLSLLGILSVLAFVLMIAKPATSLAQSDRIDALAGIVAKDFSSEEALTKDEQALVLKALISEDANEQDHGFWVSTILLFHSRHKQEYISGIGPKVKAEIENLMKADPDTPLVGYFLVISRLDIGISEATTKLIEQKMVTTSPQGKETFLRTAYYANWNNHSEILDYITKIFKESPDHREDVILVCGSAAIIGNCELIDMIDLFDVFCEAPDLTHQAQQKMFEMAFDWWGYNQSEVAHSLRGLIKSKQ